MNDDFVRLLTEEQGNPNALLLQILGDAYEDWDLIVAVEGPGDRCFYFDFVCDVLNDTKPQFFECGGKGRLLKFREAFDGYKWRRKPVIFYLCDKDFDDYLEIDYGNIFRTSHYSIESFFLGESFAGYVIDKYSSRSLTLKERGKFLEEFRSRFVSAIPVLRVVCAAMCEIRYHGEHPKFDGFGIDKIFDFTRREMKRRGGMISEMRNVLKVDSLTSYHNIMRRTKTFDPENFQGWMRGKLGLQVTKKVYELSRAAMPNTIKDKLPSANHFGSDAFKDAHSFLKELPGLREYLAA